VNNKGRDGRFKGIGFLVLLALAFGGCPYGPRPFIKPGFTRPKLVAVLPPDNHSNSMVGAVYVQRRTAEYLRKVRGWDVVDVVKVEEGLRKIAITDGGQLPSTTPEKVGEAVGAPALVYIELNEFSYTTLGLLNVKKCRAFIRIVDASSGEMLYSAEGYGAESSTAVSGRGAAEAGAAALGGQWLEKAGGAPLAVQVSDMLDRAFEWLP